MLTAHFFWLVDHHADAGIILGANDLEQDAERTGRLTLASNDIPHILGVNVQRDFHAAIVDFTGGFNVFRVIHQGLNHVFEKLLVLLHFVHIGKIKYEFARELGWKKRIITPKQGPILTILRLSYKLLPVLRSPVWRQRFPIIPS